MAAGNVNGIGPEDKTGIHSKFTQRGRGNGRGRGRGRRGRRGNNPFQPIIDRYDANELEGYRDKRLQRNFYGKLHAQAKNVHCAFYSTA